jgi:hypothetical protein
MQWGLHYVRQDNCFPWIEDFAAAQRLMDEQLSTNWPEELNRIAAARNPIHEEIFRHFQVNYYWTTHQSEWAIGRSISATGAPATTVSSLVGACDHHIGESERASISWQANAAGWECPAQLQWGIV